MVWEPQCPESRTPRPQDVKPQDPKTLGLRTSGLGTPEPWNQNARVCGLVTQGLKPGNQDQLL